MAAVRTGEHWDTEIRHSLFLQWDAIVWANHNRSQYPSREKKSPWCMKLLNVG